MKCLKTHNSMDGRLDKSGRGVGGDAWEDGIGGSVLPPAVEKSSATLNVVLAKNG